MPVQATESVGVAQAFGTGYQPAASTGATTSTSTSADKDMFLQLLVAQMKYQDPMNPTDSGEFLAQSAQFTALEKMQAVADEVAALSSSQLAFGASSLVGREVSWLAADGTELSGTVSQVRFGANGPQLVVDGTEVALGAVSTVTGSSSTTSTGTTAGTAGDAA